MPKKEELEEDADKIKEAVSGEEKKSKGNSGKISISSSESQTKGKKEKIGKELQITDLPGIGPAVAAKLESAGVFDMMSLAVMSPTNLGDAAGISSAVARKAIQAARSMLDLDFMSGDEYARKKEKVGYITTGSKNFDNLLGGKGVEAAAMTEAFGAFGCGKSQLAFSLAVNVQLPEEKGGLNGKCVFIDTEGTFVPSRIKQIAEGFELNPEQVLKNIFVARAFNADHQILLLEKIGEMIRGGEPIKLLVVDSLTAHFRAEFTGRGQLADRQQKLNKYLHQLTRLSEQHGLAVYVTNQVMANPAQMFGDPTTHVGGHIVGHAAKYRIYLRRGKQGSRVAKMVDSPNLPDSETVFFVTSAGLKDDIK